MWKIFFNIYFFLKRGKMTSGGIEACALFATMVYLVVIGCAFFSVIVYFKLYKFADFIIENKYPTLVSFGLLGIILLLYGNKRLRLFYDQK